MAGKNGASLLKAVVTLSDVASLSVLSERSVQRLTKQGIIQQAKDRQGRFMRGRYVLGETLPRLFEYTRDLATADPHAIAYNKARTRRMVALAAAEEMQLKLSRGELLERERVDREVMNVLSIVRSHLLSIPSRLMHQLVGKTDPREINMIVRGEVHRALREVSEFDAKKLRRQRSSAQRTSKHANGDDADD